MVILNNLSKIADVEDVLSIGRSGISQINSGSNY